MNHKIQFSVHEQTESSAEVILSFPREAEIQSLTGKIVGPYCQFARTLPAEFSFSATNTKLIADGRDLVRSVAKVIDPCYWSPELPFLYDLNLKLQMKDGQSVEETLKVGLTLWEQQRRNLRLDNRRFVLRGASIAQPITDTLSAARAASTALLVNRFDPAFCAAADLAGVIVCLDLRNADNARGSMLARLNVSPSVFLALIDADQSSQIDLGDPWPSHCIVAQYLSASSTQEEFVESRTAVAVELSANERPPSWLAMTARPVIAIRRGVQYADLQQARAACDRLQADLAPEFNLAGYFVAP